MTRTYILLSFIFLYASLSFAQDATLSIAADNTYALTINGNSLSSLCPDNSTGISGPTPSTCFWSNATSYSFDASSALIAVRFRNAFGDSGNALTGYTNPGAFMTELTINTTNCVSILPWTCIDDIQSAQIYDNNEPPTTWTTDPNFATSFWTTGGLTDYGPNTAQAWATGFGATAASLYGGDSFWYNATHRPVTGISAKGRWQWYNVDSGNRQLFCRLMISVNGSCPGGSFPSPSPSVSQSSSATPTPTPSISNTPTPSISQSSSASSTSTPSISYSPSPSVSQSSSATPTPTSSNTPTPSISQSPSASSTPSQSTYPSDYSTPSTSISRTPTPSSSVTSTPTSTPSSSNTPTPSSSQSSSASTTPSPTPIVPQSVSSSPSVSLIPPSVSQSPIVVCIPSPSPVAVCEPSRRPRPSRRPHQEGGGCCEELITDYEDIIGDAQDIDDRISSALSLLREVEAVNGKLDAISDVVREARRLEDLLEQRNSRR